MNKNFSKEDLDNLMTQIRNDYSEVKITGEYTKFVIDTFQTLSDAGFGNYNSEIILQYSIVPENSKFDSLDELYEYLSDPYSEYVSKDSASPLSELHQSFPDEPMFSRFLDIVNT